MAKIQIFRIYVTNIKSMCLTSVFDVTRMDPCNFRLAPHDSRPITQPSLTPPTRQMRPPRHNHMLPSQNWISKWNLSNPPVKSFWTFQCSIIFFNIIQYLFLTIKQPSVCHPLLRRLCPATTRRATSRLVITTKRPCHHLQPPNPVDGRPQCTATVAHRHLRRIATLVVTSEPARVSPFTRRWSAANR